MTMWYHPRWAGVFVAVVAAAFIFTPVAHAACTSSGSELIQSLEGRWRGNGTVTPIGGQPERILCRVSYDAKSGGHGVRQDIECVGTDYRIKATANVTCNGDRITGTWTERIASNTGSINGSLSGRRLRVSFEGPNFKGRLSVRFSSRSRHAVTISQFDPAKGRHVPVAEISLRR
jgi:hypothetical protein